METAHDLLLGEHIREFSSAPGPRQGVEQALILFFFAGVVFFGGSRGKFGQHESAPRARAHQPFRRQQPEGAADRCARYAEDVAEIQFDQMAARLGILVLQQFQDSARQFALQAAGFGASGGHAATLVFCGKNTIAVRHEKRAPKSGPFLRKYYRQRFC